jgi:hypothetical protein
MSTMNHRIYISSLVAIVVTVTFLLFYFGLDYYLTPLEERFYHPHHSWFKPSGVYGHGLGIVGTLLILIGVFGYKARKNYRSLSRLGRLKHWLEFHIFLCTLGPIMILFHTAFKFGGIVSVSFWSMVAVVASGVIGRFIYVQIPRSIEGGELSLAEIQQLKLNLDEVLRNDYQLDDVSYAEINLAVAGHPNANSGINNLLGGIIEKRWADQVRFQQIRQTLRVQKLKSKDRKRVIKLIRNEVSLNNKIERLQTMRKLFKYWHVVHLPFAMIMLIIMVIHVAVTLAFGYRWIF